MLKLKFILFLLLATSLNSFAQKLTENEKMVFDEIVYKRRNVGEYEKLSKWVVPVKYKIYGDTLSYLVKEIDTTFAELKKLTKLDISKTNIDDEANFIIVLGKDEKEYARLSSSMSRYFGKAGGFSYRTNSKNELYHSENILVPEKFRSRQEARHAIKRSIVKAFGFLKASETTPNSIFYSQANNKVTLDLFDSHIISALYNPAIKPGMTKDEVDKINP